MAIHTPKQLTIGQLGNKQPGVFEKGEHLRHLRALQPPAHSSGALLAVTSRGTMRSDLRGIALVPTIPGEGDGAAGSPATGDRFYL